MTVCPLPYSQQPYGHRYSCSSLSGLPDSICSTLVEHTAVSLSTQTLASHIGRHQSTFCDAGCATAAKCYSSARVRNMCNLLGRNTHPGERQAHLRISAMRGQQAEAVQQAQGAVGAGERKQLCLDVMHAIAQWFFVLCCADNLEWHNSGLQSADSRAALSTCREVEYRLLQVLC
jgi:hypothetical protein